MAMSITKPTWIWCNIHLLGGALDTLLGPAIRTCQLSQGASNHQYRFLNIITTLAVAAAHRIPSMQRPFSAHLPPGWHLQSLAGICDHWSCLRRRLDYGLLTRSCGVSTQGAAELLQSWPRLQGSRQRQKCQTPCKTTSMTPLQTTEKPKTCTRCALPQVPLFEFCAPALNTTKSRSCRHFALGIFSRIRSASVCQVS